MWFIDAKWYGVFWCVEWGWRTFLTHLLYIKTVTDLHRTWLPRLISRWMMLFACKCPALLQRVFFTWTCRVFKSCVDENGGKSMEISFVTRVIHQELPHGSKCLPRSKSPGWFFYTSTNQQSVKEAGCSHLDYVSCQLKSCQCRHVSWHMYRHICHGLCRLCIVTYVCVLVGIYVGMHPRVVLTPTVYYKLT